MNALDLFCGAGGLSTGLIQSGINVVAGIDIDKYAIETFNYNHPHAQGYCLDITEITPDWISTHIKVPINLICGGPPCQGFSSLGRNDARDKRNQLPLEFLRVVKMLFPEWVVIENVFGLASKRQKENLDLILNTLDDLGYTTQVEILNLAEYNVPQTRKRVFLIANRIGKESIVIPTVEPIPTFKDAWERYGSSLNHDIDKAVISNPLERDRLFCIPEGKAIRYRHDEEYYLPETLWYGVDWNILKENRFREARLRRLAWNEPSPTINTNRNVVYHPTELRYLTVREAAAIQTFPSDFVFPLHQSLTRHWTQIGNAVPPEFARRLGKALLQVSSF